MLTPPALLTRYPAMHTRNVEQLREWMANSLAVTQLESAARDGRVNCTINRCDLASISLIYASYGAPIRARIEHNDFFVQGFPLSGQGQVHWNGLAHAVCGGGAGIAGGPLATAELHYCRRFSHAILTMTPAVVIHRLSLLIDQPADAPLRLVGGVDARSAASQLRLLRFLTEELDRAPVPLPLSVLSELEDAVVTHFLFASHHNYSARLSASMPMAAPRQVKRVVDYLEQHWREALTIDRLARISEASPRSLFQLFKKTYDISPMGYLTRIRLRNAHAMLTQPDANTTVTQVGLQCGFSNLGHFAMKYQDAFGEKPSETLRRSQGPQRSRAAAPPSGDPP